MLCVIAGILSLNRDMNNRDFIVGCLAKPLQLLKGIKAEEIVRHAACMREMRNAYKILVRKPKGGR
jgi:hypothetical protein